MKPYSRNINFMVKCENTHDVTVTVWANDTYAKPSPHIKPLMLMVQQQIEILTTFTVHIYSPTMQRPTPLYI